MVRLSAGRRSLSREAVALCFVAGANSLFIAKNCSPHRIRNPKTTQPCSKRWVSNHCRFVEATAVKMEQRILASLRI